MSGCPPLNAHRHPVGVPLDIAGGDHDAPPNSAPGLLD